MLDILIYLLDTQYEEEIIRSLKGQNYIYHRAVNSDEVIENCQHDFIDIILVWPATSDIVADLLTVLNMQDLNYVPVVPVVHKDDNLSSILQLPVTDVITIPLAKQEFFTIIEQIIQNLESKPNTMQGQHWHGNLDEFSLIDLIQMVEASNKDAILAVSFKDQLGQVFFRHGKVIKATLKNLDTMSALNKMVCLYNGNFHVHFTRVDLADSIEFTNQELLVELIQQIGEQEKYYQTIPDLYNDLVTLNYPPQEKINEVNSLILENCKEGQSIYELMISMNEDNLEILKNIQELVQDGYLVSRQDFELLNKQESEKRGLGRFFNTITGIFKKGKNSLEDISMPQQPEELSEIFEPELVCQPQPVKHETVKMIQKYLEGL